MKNIKLYSIKLLSGVTLLGALFNSCTDKFEEVNTNPTKITALGTGEYGMMFAKAESVPFASYQISQNLFADLYAQYFSLTASYFQSDRYTMRFDWLTGHWNPPYTQGVPQLKTILTETEGKLPAENALAKIWWVFMFHRVTDYYGPIPYFQAGTDQKVIPYDAQDKIYDDFFKKLAEATDVLNANKDKKPFEKYDAIYAGDVDKWIKFANTLRLRLALRISDVDPARAKTEAEAAVAGGVMTAITDDAMLKVSGKGADINTFNQITNWNEFRMSASMESVLKGYNDPRVSAYFQPADATGTYEGLRNGLLPAQQGLQLNTPNYNSNVSARFTVANQNTNPQDVMHAAEAYFLRSEGALNNWNMNGTAKELYEQGIRISMNQWGTTDDAAITAYINSLATPVAPQDQQNSPALSDIPVLWGATADIQREQINTQKWIALYPDGFEAWANFRRSDYPTLYPVVASDNSDVPTGQFIKRIPFITLEKQTNGPAVTAAEALLGGPDKASTPLWWDKK
ncbi:SusD/RagB family nutrient-binding outer membrane lipoprotein [Rhodocytophaga rosea]|uniref:SusD/RagB family nutrient-binding outer membrane lipoprotein n=1 Tax=Rhodocytophaga rosea TaxID=2704465 RepID=A0A6C0GF14_9BACT|nr:SusD/RagB family nutrient-binding outer membrane lipoprotein [Rhodocytophaga rosea]QHT66556.1 SusD/RagB family nutrient-binding outer membrane lipoprotein [Rhodocytophaga rosea]